MIKSCLSPIVTFWLTGIIRHLCLAGWDSVIPTFSGFQPASFGDTLFAYIRRDNEGLFLSRRSDVLQTTGHRTCFSWNLLPVPLRSSLSMLVKSSRTKTMICQRLMSACWPPNGGDGLHRHIRCRQIYRLGTPRDYEEFIYWQVSCSILQPICCPCA